METGITIETSVFKFLVSFLFFINCYSFNIIAQNFQRNYDIPVIVDSEVLANAWAGGLNSCQISRIDANLDGIKDIFIFDRIGSKISIYINTNNTPGTIEYKYSLSFNTAFPPNLRNWVLLRDMNCDGKEDICTNAGSGFKIYYNISSTALAFDFQSSGIVQASYDFGAGPSLSGVYSIAPDLPAFNDYDDDGDIDIWSWNESSTALFFYKNLAMESDNCAVPAFVCRNRCYGMFGESTDSFEIFLDDEFQCDFNISGEMRAESRDQRHTGGTILALDLNQNGLKDLVIGDVTENNLAAVMIEDASNTLDSAVAVFNDFPATFNSTTSVQLTTFPGAFYEDIDNDGVSDLLVSPNTFSDSEDRKSLILYLNNGQNDLPDFELVQNDFFQSQMIDLGTGAYPVPFDVNNDGLQDLIIANRKYFELGNSFTSRLSYFKNTGSATAPAFTLQDNNWLNIPSFSWATVYPAFGDMDGDDDADLMLGDGNGLLHYFENTATSGEPSNFELMVNPVANADGLTLDVGQNATPQILDLDEDGKNDIVIGELNGNINYYRNSGTLNAFELQLINDSIGNVAATSILGIQGKSVPFFRKNEADEWELLVGTETGQINHYDNISGNLSGNFNLVTAAYNQISEGERSSLSMADINGDGLSDLFIGNVGGGVGIYLQQAIGIAENDTAGNMLVFPNPVKNEVEIIIMDHLLPIGEISLYDLAGNLCQTKPVRMKNTQMNVGDLPPGIYFLKLQTADSVSVQKLVIQR